MFHLFAVCAIATVRLSDVPTGVTLHVYPNTALWGSANMTSTIDTTASFVNFTVPGESPMSAECLGTLLARKHFGYTFECKFGADISLAMLHVDDHLICQRGANEALTMGMNTGPLPTLTKSKLVFRLEVYRTGHTTRARARITEHDSSVRFNASQSSARANESIACMDDMPTS